MLARRSRQFRDISAGSCPYHSMARFGSGRIRNIWVGSKAASALAVPDTGPSPVVPTELVVVPALSPPPALQHILIANHYTHIKETFSAHRTSLTAADLTVAWVRLAKITKDPSDRLSPELQKFVDILACASLDRMAQFTPGNLCSLVWAASKLKKNVAQSGMFKSFLKSWASELEAHLDELDLDQLRKVMSAITRVGFAPGPNWKLKMETALTHRLAGCSCPRTLACCLVAAASTGFALHPSPAFREAVAAACTASFTEQREWLAAAAGGAAGVAAGAAASSREAARCACSTLWAAAVLAIPLGEHTVQMMLSHVAATAADAPVFGGPSGASASAAATARPDTTTAAADPHAPLRLAGLEVSEDGDHSGSGPSIEGGRGGTAAAAAALNLELSSSTEAHAPAAVGGLTSLDFAQVFWALSRLRYAPRPGELSALLAATTSLLPSASPELLATILWGLADLEVVPPAPWLEKAYASFERQLQRASVEPLQALLHAAATLQLPAPQWSERLMDRLQDVDLRSLPDGNVVDLVMSLHALALHPPQQLAHRLQQECIKRLALRNAAAAAAGTGAGPGAGEGPVAGRAEADSPAK